MCKSQQLQKKSILRKVVWYTIFLCLLKKKSVTFLLPWVSYQFLDLYFRQSYSVILRIKVVVGRDNRQQYLLGRQPFTIVTFTVKGYVHDRILSRQPLCIVLGRSRAQVSKFVLPIVTKPFQKGSNVLLLGSLGSHTVRITHRKK